MVINLNQLGSTFIQCIQSSLLFHHIRKHAAFLLALKLRDKGKRMMIEISRKRTKRGDSRDKQHELCS